jgi:hypothetical protein
MILKIKLVRIFYAFCAVFLLITALNPAFAQTEGVKKFSKTFNVQKRIDDFGNNSDFSSMERSPQSRRKMRERQRNNRRHDRRKANQREEERTASEDQFGQDGKRRPVRNNRQRHERPSADTGIND